MILLIFLVTPLLGVLMGADVRPLRPAGGRGNLGPRLRQIQGQLNTIEAEVAYMVIS